MKSMLSADYLNKLLCRCQTTDSLIANESEVDGEIRIESCRTDRSELFHVALTDGRSTTNISLVVGGNAIHCERVNHLGVPDMRKVLSKAIGLYAYHELSVMAKD